MFTSKVTFFYYLRKGIFFIFQQIVSCYLNIFFGVGLQNVGPEKLP